MLASAGTQLCPAGAAAAAKTAAADGWRPCGRHRCVVVAVAAAPQPLEEPTWQDVSAEAPQNSAAGGRGRRSRRSTSASLASRSAPRSRSAPAAAGALGADTPGLDPQRRRRHQPNMQDQPAALQQLLQQMADDHAQAQASLLLDPAGQEQIRQQQAAAKARLTDWIQQVSEPQQLLRLLLAGGDALNGVHLTAAAAVLLRFARQTQQLELNPRYRTKVKVCLKRLTRLLQAQLLELDARGVASLLHCLAKLGHCSPLLRADSLWGDVLHVSTGQLEAFSPQQLAMAVYAAAQADGWSRTRPDRRWWAAFLEASQQQMAQFSPQGFANMAWAMGKLQRRPGPAWASELYAATQGRLGAFSPQGLANLALGLANMHCLGGCPRPGQAWIDALLAAAEQQLDGFTSQGLANLLWALAKLGYRPPHSNLSSLVSASQALLQQGSPQDLALMAYSFAALGVRPPEAWWQRFWPASAACLDDAGSQALANTFWALGRLKKMPPTQWLLAYLPALQKQLPACSAQAVANVLWAAGQLQLRQLPGSWLDAVLERSFQQLPACSSAELGISLSALQQLQHKPNSKWLDRFYVVSQPLLTSFSAHQLAGALAALGALTPDCSPPPAWSAAALAQVSARLPMLTAPSLCDTMWGVGELRLQPGRDLVARFLAEAADKMHLMSGAMLSRTLATLVRFGHTPNADWLVLLADESHYHLADMSQDELADMVWGFGRLRFSPGASWLARVQQLAGQQLHAFGSRPLLRLLQGLAGLRVRPGAAWLQAVGGRVQQLLRDMSGQQLLQFVAVLQQLGLGAAPLLVQQLTLGELGGASAPADTAAGAAAAAAAAAAAGVHPPAGFLAPAGASGAAAGIAANGKHAGEQHQQQPGQQLLAAVATLDPGAAGQHAVPAAAAHGGGNGNGNGNGTHVAVDQAAELAAGPVAEHSSSSRPADGGTPPDVASSRPGRDAASAVLLPRPQLPRRQAAAAAPLPPSLAASAPLQ